MRRVVLASCLVFGFVATNSLAWSPTTPEIAVAKFGGTLTDQSDSIVVDSSGNVYTTGRFNGTADFDPGPGTANLVSSGSTDVFVSKLNSAGELVWVKQLGGTSIAGDFSESVAVDSSGNVYTTGWFNGTADFDPGAGTANLVSAGNSDVFVSKLDSTGTFVWAKQLSGTGFESGYSVAVDSSGNVYTTGNFSGTVDFDPGLGTVNLTPAAGNNDAFVSKLDSAGAFVWAKQFGGTGTERGNEIFLDSSGNVYTTGYFEGTADFNPGAGTANLVSAGFRDVFVSKLDSTGAFVWAKRFGGTSATADHDEGFSIAVDSSGNVYTAGSFVETADFNPDDVAVANLTSAGSYDPFVSKLNSLGEFVWAKRFGGTGYDESYSVLVDSSGNVYTTGFFEGTADFDPGAGTANLVSAGSSDVFVSKLDSTGAFVWANQLASGSATNPGPSP